MKSRNITVTLDCANGNPASADVEIEIDGKRIEVPISGIEVVVDAQTGTAFLCLQFANFSVRLKNAKMVLCPGQRSQGAKLASLLKSHGD